MVFRLGIAPRRVPNFCLLKALLFSASSQLGLIKVSSGDLFFFLKNVDYYSSFFVVFWRVVRLSF